MASFVIIGRKREELDDFFLTKFRNALASLRLRDDDAVINIAPDHIFNFENPGIVATGFSGLEFPPGQDFFEKIKNVTGLPVFQSPSFCNTAGTARAEAPYLEIYSNPSQVKKIVKKLKQVKVFWDLEFHYVGSNIEYYKDDFCVKINILEREIAIVSNIILHLREIGFKRDQIWVNIIHEFISSRRMRS